MDSWKNRIGVASLQTRNIRQQKCTAYYKLGYVYSFPDFKYYFLWPLRFIFNSESMDLLNHLYATLGLQYLGLRPDIVSSYTKLYALPSE
jgi:hypothetical protein